MYLMCHLLSVRYFLPKKDICRTWNIWGCVWAMKSYNSLYYSFFCGFSSSSLASLTPQRMQQVRSVRSCAWIAVPMAVPAAWVLPADFFWGALGNASPFSLLKIESKTVWQCVYCTGGHSYGISHLPNACRKPVTNLFFCFYFFL